MKQKTTYILFLSGLLTLIPVLYGVSSAGDPCYPDQAPFEPAPCTSGEDLNWADESPAPPISPGSSSTFQVVNGTAPFTYQVRGNAFFLDPAHSQTLIENTQERSITVHTDSAACGSGVLTTVDACLTKITTTIPTTIELKWDATSLEEEMPATGSTTIAVQDGSPPFTFSISGSGFSLENTGTPQTTVEQSSRSITVQTMNACGAGSLSVIDNCGSTIKHTIRSATGYWKNLGTLPDCPWTTPFAEWDNPRLYEYYHVRGAQMIYNHIVYRGGC